MTRAPNRRALALPLCLLSLAGGACHGKKTDDNASQPTSGGATTAQLSEAQVVGAVVATTQALAVADSTAATLIDSPGIKGYATVLRVDHRAIADEVQAVADTISIAGTTSPTGDRLRTEATAITTALADTTADRGGAYVAAQIEMQRHLIGAMDSLLIPAAKTPQLRQVLQDLRPAMVAHLQRGEQIAQILANAAAAPRVAARISPDSARAPRDTTGAANAGAAGSTGGATPPVKRDSTKVLPDTIH